MFLVQQRTRFKNRIQGALARYTIQLAVRDEGRRHLDMQLKELPQHTRESVGLELATHFLEMQIEEVRKRREAILQVSTETGGCQE